MYIHNHNFVLVKTYNCKWVQNCDFSLTILVHNGSVEIHFYNHCSYLQLYATYNCTITILLWNRPPAYLDPAHDLHDEANLLAHHNWRS